MKLKKTENGSTPEKKACWQKKSAQALAWRRKKKMLLRAWRRRKEKGGKVRINEEHETVEGETETLKYLLIYRRSQNVQCNADMAKASEINKCKLGGGAFEDEGEDEEEEKKLLMSENGSKEEKSYLQTDIESASQLSMKENLARKTAGSCTKLEATGCNAKRSTITYLKSADFWREESSLAAALLEEGENCGKPLKSAQALFIRTFYQRWKLCWRKIARKRAGEREREALQASTPWLPSLSATTNSVRWRKPGRRTFASLQACRWLPLKEAPAAGEESTGAS